MKKVVEEKLVSLRSSFCLVHLEVHLWGTGRRRKGSSLIQFLFILTFFSRWTGGAGEETAKRSMAGHILIRGSQPLPAGIILKPGYSEWAAGRLPSC